MTEIPFLVVPSPLQSSRDGDTGEGAEPPLWLWQCPGRTRGCTGRGWRRHRHSSQLFSSSCREVQPEVGETLRKWFLQGRGEEQAGPAVVPRPLWLYRGHWGHPGALSGPSGASPPWLCRDISSFSSSDEFQRVLHDKSSFLGFFSSFLEPLPPSLLFHISCSISIHHHHHLLLTRVQLGTGSLFFSGGWVFLLVERAGVGYLSALPPGQGRGG